MAQDDRIGLTDQRCAAVMIGSPSFKKKTEQKSFSQGKRQTGISTPQGHKCTTRRRVGGGIQRVGEERYGGRNGPKCWTDEGGELGETAGNSKYLKETAIVLSFPKSQSIL